MAILPEKTDEESTVTVIIPTFRRTELALSLAKKISAKNPEIEILIVDQKSEYAGIGLKKIPENIRYFNIDIANLPNARNFGLKKAKGEIIIFLDDDSEPAGNFIKAHQSSYSDREVVAVAGRVINDNENVPKNTDVLTAKMNWLGTAFSGKFWSTKPQEVGYVYGCNMSFRKDKLLKINGFDKNFLNLFEEIDASVRIKKYGKILFNPTALVYHHKAPSGGTRENMKDRMKIYYNCYGYFLRKNILFPLSLFSLLIRSRNAVQESFGCLLSFYWGYLKISTK